MHKYVENVGLTMAPIAHEVEGDVLRVDFHDPPLVADRRSRKGDFIFHYRGGEPIGVTIVGFSRYAGLVRLLVERLPAGELKALEEALS